MIERRYPIQTVLANRKMFAGGGVVSPQQTAAPVQPSMGILSSSSPLMEAVAADAVNPDGGNTLDESVEFNEGGAVRGYAHGGAYMQNLEETVPPYYPGEEIVQTESVPLPQVTSGQSSREEIERLARVEFVENAQAAKAAKAARRRNAQPVITETGLGEELNIPERSVQSRIAQGLRRQQERRRDEYFGRPGISEENPIGTAVNAADFAELMGSEDSTSFDVGETTADPSLGLVLGGAEDKLAEPGAAEPEAAEPTSDLAMTDESFNEAEAVNAADFAELMGSKDSTSDAEKKSIVNLLQSGMSGKDPKELKSFVAEFKEAMPTFDGMSDSEKGFAIMEAGLRVMGGQSEFALVNIANGLKGLGAEFAKDAKEKRAWDRQVDLSAAKYALDGVAKEQAKRDALEKEGRKAFKVVAFRDFKDPATGKEVSKGQSFIVSRSQVDAGILQNLPLTFIETYTAEANAAAAIAEKLADLAENARKEKIIDYKEGEQIGKNISDARENFIHASSGSYLVEGMIKKIVETPGEIVGGKAAISQIYGDIKNIFGKSDKKYNSLKAFETDLKIALQKLIPVALRNIQAGNSISDRDVSNLAKAFIAGGIINRDENGVITLNVDLAKMSPDILVGKLQEMNEMFREAQQTSLDTFDQEIYTLSQAGPGRYDIRRFEPSLRRMAPALEAYRDKAGNTKTPTASTILNAKEYFDMDTGKLLKPIPRRKR